MLLKLCVCCFILLGSTACNKSSNEVNNLKLWYETPARKWVEALPLGNGRLGAMVFGTPGEEKLQLNEETVWAGQPNNNINPEAKHHLAEIRNLMFQGKWKEAQELVDKTVIPKTNQGMSYQPVGDLHIAFPGHEQPDHYYRELDLTSAIATTRYTVDGVEYTREVFSSFTGQVIIMRLTASEKGKLDFTTWLTSPQQAKFSAQGDELLLKGISGTQEGLEGKVKFTTQVKIVPDEGKLSVEGKRITVTDANAATLYISMASNFVNYHDISANDAERAQNYLNAALLKGYPRLRGEHIEFYRKYFERVQMDLGVTDSVRKPTDRRIAEFATSNDPQLATLYFQFGRYLLISCSQPGGQAANLQGIWNDLMEAPWDSKYTTNINAEMNYWPAEVTNLPELHEPFIQMVKDVSVTGAETARQMYGARGWVMHHNTDLWRLTGPVDYAAPGMWPSGGAWFCQHLWERYLYSGDKAYLAEVYPVMKGAATFMLDFAVEEPAHQWLVIAPSNSPEHAFEKGWTNTYGVTMDNQLMFELFSNVVSASRILGVDQAFADSLKQARAKLAPMHIGQYSQLQEWLFDWDNPKDTHRHVSHLYGVFPGNLISPYRTPELFDAARTSLLHRGDASTGWSMGWKVCLWARFQDGSHAYKLISDQIKLVDENSKTGGQGGTYPNMFDAHPPFQIDGNFGCTAGIAEMFVQSHDGAIHILPALPDAWRKGKIGGLRLRGGFLLESLEWENGKVKTLRVKSTLGGNLRLRTSEALTGTSLVKAEGVNTNPFFTTPDVPAPIISPQAKIKPVNVKPVLEYDVATEPGNEYIFTLSESR